MKKTIKIQKNQKRKNTVETDRIPIVSKIDPLSDENSIKFI